MNRARVATFLKETRENSTLITDFVIDKFGVLARLEPTGGYSGDAITGLIAKFALRNARGAPASMGNFRRAWTRAKAMKGIEARNRRSRAAAKDGWRGALQAAEPALPMAVPPRPVLPVVHAPEIAGTAEPTPADTIDAEIERVLTQHRAGLPRMPVPPGLQ